MTDAHRERAVAHAFGSLIDALLDGFDVVDLPTTLTDRSTGLVSQRLDVDLPDAFDLLRNLANDSDQQLTEVSRELLGTRGGPNELLAALATARRKPPMPRWLPASAEAGSTDAETQAP